MDPVVSEAEFTRWLTLDHRSIPKGDGPDSENDALERIAAYDGALLEEFFATLPERAAFWSEMLVSLRAKLVRERETSADTPTVAGMPLPPVPIDTVGTHSIATYIERLKWVAGLKTNPDFVARNGHHRLHVVAIALRYGIDSAVRYMRGGSAIWSDDDVQDAYDASQDLEVLIYQQRGDAVRFSPGMSAGGEQPTMET
jgi:hypothetical protein